MHSTCSDDEFVLKLISLQACSERDGGMLEGYRERERPNKHNGMCGMFGNL